MLTHMGGPFWARKDDGAWSIPKGEYALPEEPYAAALREFAEELGSPAPQGPSHDLGELRQSSGKRVWVWAIEADLDVSAITSNTFELEWPPKSGQLQQFPEVDRADWFDLPTAKRKLVKGQRPFIDALAERIASLS
jgi:predicted NUDIX family NTP pyrophosphohydrolase